VQRQIGRVAAPGQNEGVVRTQGAAQSAWSNCQCQLLTVAAFCAAIRWKPPPAASVVALQHRFVSSTSLAPLIPNRQQQQQQ
jgi:hypothetical protein